MKKSIIKTELDVFLNNLKFNEQYYSMYNKIYNEQIKLSQEIFVFIILQLTSQTNFRGNFYEIYLDVIKRKSDYIRALIHNFKIAILGKPTIYKKIYKFLCCKKMPDCEIQFHNKMNFFDFDKMFDEIFELNHNAKKSQFVRISQYIYNVPVSELFHEKPSVKIKKVHFIL